MGSERALTSLPGTPYRTPPRPAHVNYDERSVPAYSLPDVLRNEDGTRVTSAIEFEQRRRPELLELFSREVYGRAPLHAGLDVRAVAEDDALFGLATRVELDVSVYPRGAAAPLELGLLAWIPKRARPCPAFLGLNIAGNQTVHPDSAVRLSRGWAPYMPEIGLYQHRASEASRGLHATRWPVEVAVARGFAVVTAYAGDLSPDFPDGASQSVLRSQTGTGDDAAGSIALWAFGISRMLDAVATLDGIDAARVGVIGHSRLGKAALWAAALDPRFAFVIANGSGRGGAALLRRRFGETTRDLNMRFPHWFCSNFRRYDDREHALPVDQHELLALVAPRPLYLGNAEQDHWCDPKGELLAAQAVEPVYRLFGQRGLVAPEVLELGRSYGDRVGYHLRPGSHELLPADFWHYLAFAERHL
jgi:hypothetical protein